MQNVRIAQGPAHEDSKQDQHTRPESDTGLVTIFIGSPTQDGEQGQRE
jgi:hypothetical protein